MKLLDACELIVDCPHSTAKDEGSGYPLIRTPNVGRGRLKLEGVHRVSYETYCARNERAVPQTDDLILAREAPVGNVAIIKEGQQVCLGQRTVLIRPNKNIVEPDFLVYYLLSPEMQHVLLSSANGATVSHLNMADIRKLEISLPDLEVQKKIGRLLSTIEDKIETNNEINDNLLQQAIALYKHFLQDAEWPTASILDIAKKVAMGPFGSNIKVSTFVPEGVPIISGNHLRGYFLEEPEFNYITEEHAERLKNSIVYPHDLIFTHAGNIGQVAMIPDGCKYDHYVLSQRQFYLRCDETKVVPEFLLMFFHSASGQHELLSYANQTGVPSIAQPASNLKKIPFKCPPIQEQLKWQEQVHPLLGKYLNNRFENERLSALRDVLLPKLMSGELDVSNLDI